MKMRKISSTKVCFVLFLTMLFFSCASTKKTVAAKESTKEASNSYKTKYIRDTVLIRDSSATSVRNDTIFAERWHVKYLSRAVHDTVRATDTVMVTKIETKEVKIKPTLKEKIEEYMLIFVIFVSLYIIAKLIWKKI